MSQPISHITQVEIQQLWNDPELNIKWNLHRDVNILAGDNGSGKSTILNSIFWLLGNRNVYSRRKNSPINSLSITFNESSVATLHGFKGTPEQLEREAESNEHLRDFLLELKVREGKNYRNVETLGLYYPTLNGNPIEREELRNLIRVDSISTSDELLIPLEIARRYEGQKIKTLLDLLITSLEKSYLNYQVEVGKLALKALSSSTDIGEVRQTNQQLDAQKNLFLDMIDELFGATQKRIDRDNNGIAFIKRGKTKLGYYDLSSGEKQMLMILLTALVQNNKPTVMIMDEPELSLHTDWQEKLIGYIRQLNENAQIIIATHSPSIVINGWHDKVFEINDILVK